MKLMKEPELKKLVTDFEGYYLRDKKMHEIDAELFYVVEEKQNSVELSEKGNDLVAQKEPDLFVMERLDDILNAVDEICVEAFLQEKISFLNITEHIETIMNKHTIVGSP